MKTLFKYLTYSFALVFGLVACDGFNSGYDNGNLDVDTEQFAKNLETDLEMSDDQVIALKDILESYANEQRSPGFIWRVAAGLQDTLDDAQKEYLYLQADTAKTMHLVRVLIGPMPGIGNGKGEDSNRDNKPVAFVPPPVRDLLTDEQKAALLAVHEDYKPQFETAFESFSNGETSPADFVDTVVALKSEIRTAVEAILTEDQLAACLFLITSCRCSDSPEAPTTDSDTIESGTSLQSPQYVMKDVKISHENCEGELMECTQVQFSYPRFSSSELAGINALIYSTLSNPELKLNINEAISEQSLADSAQRFIDDYANFINDIGETSQHWFWVGDAEFSQENEAFFTLKFTLELYSGGAHQITKEQFINIFKTGKVIVVNDLFKEGSKELISIEIAQSFRKQQRLTASQPLTEAGLFKDEIPYTSNVKISGDGMLFHYNPYEIAPWTSGPIDVMVSFSSLDQVLTSEWKEILSPSHKIN